MASNPFLIVIFFFVISPFGAKETTAQATETVDSQDRLITVSGEGLVPVVPSMARIRFGVVSRDMDPEEARRANASTAAEAMHIVRSMGIQERRIRLEMLQIQPFREYNVELRRYEEAGFEAVRSIVVELYDLEKMPEMVTGIVQHGANRLDNVSYDLIPEHYDEVRREALRKAVIDAREKAVLIAHSLDEEIGEVRFVTELSFDFPRPMLQMARQEVAVGKDDAVPEPEAYAAGEIEVRVRVQAAFELANSQ